MAKSSTPPPGKVASHWPELQPNSPSLPVPKLMMSKKPVLVELALAPLSTLRAVVRSPTPAEDFTTSTLHWPGRLMLPSSVKLPLAMWPPTEASPASSTTTDSALLLPELPPYVVRAWTAPGRLASILISRPDWLPRKVAACPNGLPLE